MKQTIAFLSGCIFTLVVCVSFMAPSSANASPDKSNSAYVETGRSMFYTGVWNTCLTLAAQTGKLSSAQINNTCRFTLKQALTIKAFEYRHTDMWQPVPSDIYKVVIAP